MTFIFLHSFSIKNIFYDKMDLRLFFFNVTIWFAFLLVLFLAEISYKSLVVPSFYHRNQSLRVIDINVIFSYASVCSEHHFSDFLQNWL